MVAVGKLTNKLCNDNPCFKCGGKSVPAAQLDQSFMHAGLACRTIVCRTINPKHMRSWSVTCDHGIMFQTCFEQVMQASGGAGGRGGAGAMLNAVTALEGLLPILPPEAVRQQVIKARQVPEDLFNNRTNTLLGA